MKKTLFEAKLTTPIISLMLHIHKPNIELSKILCLRSVTIHFTAQVVFAQALYNNICSSLDMIIFTQVWKNNICSSLINHSIIEVSTNMLWYILSLCQAFKKRFSQWQSSPIALLWIWTWVIGLSPCVLSQKESVLLSYHGVNFHIHAFLWDWLHHQMSTKRRCPSCSLI